MARALGPVERMGIGLIPPDLRLSLARHYSGLSDYGRALPLYLGAAEGEATTAAVELETARTFQELGGCREALGYFESYPRSGRLGRHGPVRRPVAVRKLPVRRWRRKISGRVGTGRRRRTWTC